MKIKRDFVTPSITVLFFAVGLSGVLMFFHAFDGYTETVHEVLGLMFVLFSVLHVIINWESLKAHFPKRMFLASAIIVLLLSVGLIISGKSHGEHERIFMEKLVKAPISNIFSILDVEYNEAESKLKEHNITIGSSKTLEEVCRNNKTSPKDILELIIDRPI